MIAAIGKRRARPAGERGFTLIELLVVIVILGILAAVVVFAVGGINDRGQNSAVKADAETLRTAQEVFCGKEGRYATNDSQLVDEGLLSAESELHEVASGGFNSGSCGSYIIDAEEPGFGQADQVDVLKIPTTPSPTVMGFPSPFAFGVGPGFNNMHYVFDSLTWKDATGGYIPWVATSVPTRTADGGNGLLSDDGLTYTYNIRPGIRFSDGQLLDASDVAFTYDYITPQDTDPTDGAVNRKAGAGIVGAFYYSLDFISTVTASGVGADGGGTVTFTLTAPFAPFEAIFGSRVPIIPEHIWSTVTNPRVYGTAGDTAGDRVVDAPRAVTGSGPYTVDNPAASPMAENTYAFRARTAERVTQPPQAWEVAPPPAFFLGDPFVRKLQLEATPSPPGPLGALAAGTVDAAGPQDGQAVPSSLNGFDRISAGGENTLALHFNMLPEACGTLPACVNGARPPGASLRSFPYDNKVFRQAVAYTVDRKQLVSTAIGGLGEPGSMGALAPTHAFLAPGLPTYDREVQRAKDLLTSIGIVDSNADGFRELPCTPKPCTGTTGVNFQPVIKYEAPIPPNAAITGSAGAVVNYFRDIGIEASQSTTNFTRANVTRGEYDIALQSYGAMGAEPDQLRNRISRFDTTLQFTDVYGFTPATSEFDALAAAQVGNLNADSRRSQLHRMQQIIADEVPLISLWVPNRTWVFNSKPVPWYFTPGGLWSGWPGAPSKQLFVDGKRVAPPR